MNRATPNEWRVGEGTWRPVAQGWEHPDPFDKGGLLGRPRHIYAHVSFSANIRITTFSNQVAPWAALIVAGRCPLAEGAWGAGCMVQLAPQGELTLLDPLLGTRVGPLPTGLNPVRASVRVRVEVKGTSLTVYLNNQPRLNYRSPNPLQGEVALANFGCTARFDDLALHGSNGRLEPFPLVLPTQTQPARLTAVTPLPRLAAWRQPAGRGRLYETATGRSLRPVGFNYTFYGDWTHATFNVDRYDPARVERDLIAMRAAGAQCVRVWAWGEQSHGGGNAGAPTSTSLNPAYMTNFIDFLRRANRHQLYVWAVLDDVPLNARYRGILEHTVSNDPEWIITGQNRRFLSREWIAAKAAQIEDFVGYIKAADPNLLSTIMAWAFTNEAWANTSEGPFRHAAGRVRLINHRSYDMADFNDRQRCWDDGIVLYARELSRAVRKVDPAALTTIGFWTANGHARQPINGLYPDWRDPRVPPRPAALAHPDAELSFLDMHLYNHGNQFWLDSVAMELREVRWWGTPILAGEFGVGIYPGLSPDVARYLYLEAFTQLQWAGVQGAIYWDWASVYETGTWHYPRLMNPLPLTWPTLRGPTNSFEEQLRKYYRGKQTIYRFREPRVLMPPDWNKKLNP